MCPGALASKGCGALGARATRQRVAVAPAGADPGCVISRHGVRPLPAARLKRRPAVRSTSSKTPNASARLEARRLSSSAFNASAARGVSTMISRAGSSPRRTRPAAESPPNSPAIARDQHHTIHGLPTPPPADALLAACKAVRRTPRRAAKPKAVIQSPAEAPGRTSARLPAAPPVAATAFTSCVAATSSPPGSKASSAGQPSPHRSEHP